MTSTVTYSHSRNPSQIDDDDIQISLAPYLQTYLAQVGHQPSCCPILFERASSTWWDPKFDSEILEGQYWRSSLPQIRLRFQYALLYIFFVSFTWCIYFAAMTTRNWLVIVITLLVVKFIIASILLFTYTSHYQHHYLSVSITVSVLLCALSLILLIYEADDQFTVDITPVGLFSICIEILLLLYTVIPLPLYICIIMGGLYSTIFEFLAATFPGMNGAIPISIRALLHVCIHIIGVHILIMTHVRMRGTFMKVGQSLLVRRQLEMEKQLKEKMIHSVMPPKVADWLMKEGHSDDSGEDMYCSESGAMLRKPSSPRSSNPGDIRSLFRPFNMHRMEDVSILFADIVGFTKMSSNKTAEQLVGLLNDLFERFDDLCVNHGCEKISTLGDCYYCVSGCPEPRVDHAQCCVEMGLSMITAIRQFDEDRGENINMRVGVHTGTVLCGIVGTKRFKFDVWSNDVTLANQMESTGMPGRVHISEKTYQFLEDHYIFEDGEMVQGVKTYFILGRKSDANNKLNPWLELPSPLSPHAHHLSPLSHHLEMMSSKKACSLPSILDSDNDMPEQEEPAKSPTSLTGRNRYSHSKQFHPLKFTRRIVRSEKNSPEIKNNRPFSPLKDAQGSVDNKYHQIFEHKDKTGEETVSHLEVPVTEDQLSVNLSINSRKDSGIRSNSRRSSIQQQIFVMNGIAQGELLTHRVSGYYTSSQSTVNENEAEHGNCDRDNCHNVTVPLNESITCFHQLRKQSDLQLIKCVQDNSSHRSYFVKPPLSQLTLFFIQPEMEKEYRTHAHRREDKDSPPTLASSRFNTYFDILVSAVVYIIISFSLFVLYDHPLLWLIFCFLATFCQLFIVLLCIRQLLGPRQTGSCIKTLYDLCIQWYPWHICGAILVSLPVISVFTNFSCTNFVEVKGSAQFFCVLFIVGLVHFCNFTQLNCWMKSTLASIAGILFVILVASKVCPCPFDSHQNKYSNITSDNSTAGNKTLSEVYSSEHHFHEEIVVDIFLLLCLVWFLNREFEISYRLSFHGNVVAARDKARVQVMKDQADWLLHNIIPKHVAEQLKSTAKYSENHKEVGIIFASIVNFNEMYDESYLGGKEYLRVLNELIGDFDELLREPQYRNVEKIKTIGSTFMAASGLNPQVRKESTHKYQHLFELVNFAMNLQKVIDNFNRDLLEFNLILRIGYNHGDVTSGVIGTTKLYYDIWGDAVNIASRMDSTGIKGRIQVGEACLPILEERYEFEPRGSVYVKGKDNMNVYLLKDKKDSVGSC